MLKFFKSGLEKTKRVYNSVNAKLNNRLLLAAGLVTVFVCAVAVLLGTVKTVKVWDGNQMFTVRTVSGDTNAIVASLDLKSNKYILEQGENGTVVVKYTFPVYITVGASTVTLDTAEDTVGNILTKAGYTVDEYDMIQPERDAVISATTFIDYYDIDYIKGEYEQAIPYETVTSYSKNQTATTFTKGVEGLEKVYYTEKTVNGVSVEKVIDKKETVTEPVNAVKVVGTARYVAASVSGSAAKCISTLVPSSPIELDGNGVPVNYKKHITVQATAYTYTGHKCSTGVNPQPGYIAVNPKEIPYGTKMYIVSSDGKFNYGYAVAADTGGFIKTRPTNVDLFFTTLAGCTQFGRRNVEIYFLED